MRRTTMMTGAVTGLGWAFLASLAIAQPAPSPAAGPIPAADFVKAAGQSDQFEIQEGQLAQSMAKDARVKHFGAEMVKDHTKTTESLMKAVQRAGMPVPPPPPLRPDQQQKVAQLQGLSGKAFDQAYIDQQVAAHQEALSLMTTYGASGDVPELKHAANKTTPIVQQHLSMVQDMQRMMAPTP